MKIAYSSKAVLDRYRLDDKGQVHFMITYLVNMGPKIGMSSITVENSVEWLWRIIFRAKMTGDTMPVPSHEEIVKRAGLTIDTPGTGKDRFVRTMINELERRINATMISQVGITGFIPGVAVWTGITADAIGWRITVNWSAPATSPPSDPPSQPPLPWIPDLEVGETELDGPALSESLG